MQEFYSLIRGRVKTVLRIWVRLKMETWRIVRAEDTGQGVTARQPLH
jgi:hypothetical protein